jgi:hypothetical protein
LGLAAYRAAIGSSFALAAVVTASGLRCEKCGDGGCARRHAVRSRKHITDLTTGEVFENLPIVRVVFCSKKTASLVPGELWRGRFTVSSVVEAVVRVHRDGVEAASEWALYAGTGEEVVSERTLLRWRNIVRTRLVGSALSCLGPLLGLSWSDASEPAGQLETILERLSGTALLAFRSLTGYAVLDAPSARCSSTRSTTRRVPGRLAPTPPHIAPSPRRPRGAWSHPRKSRAPPRLDLKEPPS